MNDTDCVHCTDLCEIEIFDLREVQSQKNQCKDLHKIRDHPRAQRAARDDQSVSDTRDTSVVGCSACDSRDPNRSIEQREVQRRHLDCCIGLKVSDLVTVLGNHHEITLTGYDSWTGSIVTGFHRYHMSCTRDFWRLPRSTPGPTISQDMKLP